MPHSLFELNKMTREQLEAIAEKFKIKSKKLDDEHLAYEILDAEAKEASENTTPYKPRGRKPRAPKEKKAAPAPITPDEEKAAPAAAAPNEETPAAEPKASPQKPAETYTPESSS